MTPERLARLSEVLARRQPDLTVIAENARKSGNIAALLRTCDAVGVNEMHAVSRNSIRRHHHVSAGAARWVRLRRHDSIGAVCDELHGRGFRIFAAHSSRRAIDFRDADYTRPCAVLLGGELWGVSATAAARADAHIVVPMQGMVESLNVSVAAALVLFEAMRQREAGGGYAGTRLAPAEFRRLLFEWAYPRIARRCRERGVAYPRLAADGSVVENPFIEAGAVSVDKERKNGNGNLERRRRRRE